MKPPSGNFVVRISPDLHGRLRDLAAKRGQSLNRLCADVLEGAVCPDIGTQSSPAAGSGTAPRILAEKCAQVFGEDLLGVVLFGSIARGEAFPDSDLDILVVMDRSRPIRRNLYSRWQDTLSSFAEQTFPHEVNPHFSHLPESPENAGALWLEIAIDGIVLWERAGEVSAALRALRAHLAAGKAVRRVRHGHPYWVRGRPSLREGERS